MATIREVAQAAGVSPATVSRILSGQGSFSEDTIRHVQHIARELNYRPNTRMGSLSAKRTGIIGVLLPSCTIPAYTAALSGIAAECARHDLSPLLSPEYLTLQQEKDAVFAMSQKPMDALIYLPLHSAAPLKGLNAFSDMPRVCIYRRTAGYDMPCVHADSFQAGYLTTKYLLSLGRQHILYSAGFFQSEFIGDVHQLNRLVNSDMAGSYTSVDRFRGHLKALEEAGIEHNDNMVLVRSLGTRSYDDILVRASITPRIDAIAGVSDLQAIRFIPQLIQHGHRVPEDISVVGFDDVPWSGDVALPLTTVHVPMKEMGEMAVRVAIDQLEGRKVEPTYALPVQMVLRKSTAPKKTP